MAITLHQEELPFSNKRVANPVSQNGAYTNPVIMSFAFDFTVCTNVLESVIYIRNNDANKYYRNVVVTLMKDDPNVLSPSMTYGTIQTHGTLGPVIRIANTYDVPISYSVEQPPAIPAEGITITGAYETDAVPIIDYRLGSDSIYTDDNIGVKFSYGYDELSNVEWESQNSALVIPQLGTINIPDTSYIPIRMRILWKNASSLFTIRNYYIDISYEKEQIIGEVM